MRKLSKQPRVLMTSALVFCLAACASVPEPQYYVLGQASMNTPSFGATPISVVTIPTYLRHDGIALATSPHMIHHAKSHRWAEPLSEGIRRAMQNHITDKDGNDQIDRVDIDVDYFHGDTDGRVVLQARWQIVLLCGTEHVGSYHGRTDIKTSGYQPLVAAHQNLVADMSREITDSAREFECPSA